MERDLLIAELSRLRRGSFVGIIQTLQGSVKGGVRYGDALIHDVFVSGFSYQKLKTRDGLVLSKISRKALERALLNNPTMAWDNPRLKNPNPVPVSLRDMEEALQSLIDSTQKSVAGINSATTDAAYDPLVLPNGDIVPGVRVYVGSGGAAPVGTLYIQGLKVSRRVLSDPPNGWPPEGKSGPVTLAKALITQEWELPSRRYVSYKLDTSLPPGSWILSLGTR